MSNVVVAILIMAAVSIIIAIAKKAFKIALYLCLAYAIFCFASTYI